jgi:hypothetical protein
MKRTVWFAVVLGLLGVWGGVRAWSHPSFDVAIHSGIAVVTGCNLVLMTWLWWRPC